MTMLLSTMIAVALGAVLVVAAPAVRALAQQAATAVAVAADPVTIEMTVTGLSCPFCAYGLEKRLKKLDSLETIDIDPETGKVTLVLEDAREATEERIRRLVDEAGFKVDRFIRAPWLPDVG